MKAGPAVHDTLRLARLTAGHAADLAASGLSVETIERAGLYSASGPEASALLGYGVGPGLVFPYEWNGDGQPTYARVKLDHAGSDGKRYRSPRGSANRLYIPRCVHLSSLVNVATPLVITEGEKKTLSAVQAGLACVGLAGVWAWRTRRADGASGPLLDLEVLPWTGRDVRLVFDSDTATKPEVARAERELAAELTRRGARVSVVRLPADPAGGKVGLDDFLVAHGLDAFQALPRLPALPAVVPVRLAVEGGGAFVAHTFPDVEPYVEGVLSSEGGGWLGGEEKLGKSFYMLAESAALALGQPVCGRFPVPARRRVLILEEEDSPRRTHRRLRALLRGYDVDPDDPAVRADLDGWLRVAVWSGFSLDSPEWVQELSAEIAGFRPAVVYLDALRKVTVRDLNKADQAGALLAVLDDLRRTFGVVFRIVHHYRKGQGFRVGRGSQEIGGSYVLGAWGENSLFFEPIGRTQGAVRVSVQTKDGPPVPAFRLIIDAEGPAHAPAAVRLRVEDDADPNEADELVFQAVASLPKQEAVTGKPGVSVKAVAAAIRKADKTVRRALDRLCEANRCLVTGSMSKGAKLYAVNGE